MEIVETIRRRRSVRSYTGEALSSEHAALVEDYLNRLRPRFETDARVRLIHSDAGASRPVKLGTYGWVRGAKDYLVLSYSKATSAEMPAEESAAYLFEQVVLYCTSLGLGTCWLGGSFSRKDFGRQVSLKPGEKLRIVSPVGYASDKKGFIETYIVGAEKHHNSRKPFGAGFFLNDFSTPLTEEAAGIYALPLEMVRLAPSANNKQPWRVTLDGNVLHFYKTFSFGFASIDLGIALCHFGETCRELGIAGHFRIVDTPPAEKNARYTISWIGEKAAVETSLQGLKHV
jgi:nitroreductase